ncbi:hypothetical protein Tco_0166273, partial [Tanacetum coccineum]
MAMNVIAWICYVCEGSALCICSSTSRPVGAYDLGVATPIALVYAGLMTSGDAKSWYMISGDVKSWVLSVLAYIHCVFFIKVNGWYWILKRSTLGGLGFKTE